MNPVKPGSACLTWQCSSKPEVRGWCLPCWQALVEHEGEYLRPWDRAYVLITCVHCEQGLATMGMLCQQCWRACAVRRKINRPFILCGECGDDQATVKGLCNSCWRKIHRQTDAFKQAQKKSDFKYRTKPEVVKARKKRRDTEEYREQRKLHDKKYYSSAKIKRKRKLRDRARYLARKGFTKARVILVS